MNPARRNDMKRTRKAVNMEYERFKSMNLIDESRGPFFQILDKKIKGLPLRAYFMRKAYDYLTAGKEVNQLLPASFFTHRLPFIAETIISIQYYHNQILDGKGGVNNLEKAGVNAITANLLKDALFLYLERVTDDKPINDFLIKEVRSIFMLVDSGQFIERNCGTYKVWRKNTRPQHQFEELTYNFIDGQIVDQVIECVKLLSFFNKVEISFIRKYIERIYLTNGTLYIKLVSVILKLLSIEKDKAFIQFIAFFAIMQQVVNDNGDMVPGGYNLCTEVKTPEDAFNDLKTRTMTMPLCIHSRRCPEGSVIRYLSSKRKKIKASEEMIFFTELIESHSIYYSMSFGKAIKRKAITLLDTNNPEFPWIENMCEVAENNKYYKCFYDLEAAYKDYGKQKTFIC